METEAVATVLTQEELDKMLRGELFHCPVGHHTGGDSLQGPKSTIIGLIYHKQFNYNPSLAYARKGL